MLDTTARAGDVLSSLPGTPSSGTQIVPDLSLALRNVFQDTLRIQDGVSGGTPRDTRTRQQRASDDAAGRVYNPADGTYSDPASGGGSGVTAIPSKVGGWLFHWLFDDVISASGDLQTAARKAGVLVLLAILGTMLLYLGIKTLAE